MTTSVFSPPLKKRRASVRTQALAALLIVLVLLILYYPRLVGYLAGQTPGGLRGETAAAPTDRVLVSYSYFEKDPIQVGAGKAQAVAGRAGCCPPGTPPATAAAACRCPRYRLLPPLPLAHQGDARSCTHLPCVPRLALQRDNFDYFITVGMGLDNRYGGPANADFVVVVNGKVGAAVHRAARWVLPRACTVCVAWTLQRGCHEARARSTPNHTSSAHTARPPVCACRCAAPARACTRCSRRRRRCCPACRRCTRGRAWRCSSAPKTRAWISRRTTSR